MTRRASQATVTLIEGEEGCPLYAYDDAVYPTRPATKGEKIKGTLTIATGHVGPEVYIGMVCTQAQADNWLDADLDTAERAVDTLVKVPLNDFQFGALVSFVFNIGVAAFQGSTLLKVLNQGNYDAVPDQMTRWNKTKIASKLVESDGLTSRRVKEAAFFKAMVAVVPENVDVAHTASPSAVAAPQAKPWITVDQIATLAPVIAGGGAFVAGTGPVQIALAIVMVLGFALGAGLFVYQRVVAK